MKSCIAVVGGALAGAFLAATALTGDAWGREENVILEIPSQDLAAHYSRDFEALWQRGHVTHTVPLAGGLAQLWYGGAQLNAMKGDLQGALGAHAG